jgi:hypothetical protein
MRSAPSRPRLWRSGSPTSRKLASSNGIIDARPPLVEYRLTDRGRKLKALVDALARFAETA